MIWFPDTIGPVRIGSRSCRNQGDRSSDRPT